MTLVILTLLLQPSYVLAKSKKLNKKPFHRKKVCKKGKVRDFIAIREIVGQETDLNIPRALL